MKNELMSSNKVLTVKKNNEVCPYKNYRKLRQMSNGVLQNLLSDEISLKLFSDLTNQR